MQISKLANLQMCKFENVQMADVLMADFRMADGECLMRSFRINFIFL
jgi:hypothetical protein